jgi:hypothetical protein
MSRSKGRADAVLAALLALLLGAGVALSQRTTPRRVLPAPAPDPGKVVPRFEALAETRLLMEGLNQANYRSLDKLLKEKPGDPDTWSFARGQALLIAETGNLLLLRPPHNQGREAWWQQSMELRHSADTLARRLGSEDYEGSRKALDALARTCNRCHQTFRVPVRVGPEPMPRVRDVE